MGKCKGKIGYIFPRCVLFKSLRYEEQTETPNWFCLLWVEMLYGGEIFKNHDFRKKLSEKEVQNSQMFTLI